jgi:double-stranded uracil-DNA glycosylase
MAGGVEPLHCFAPIVRPDTRLLIIGSLPGAASLAAGRYYAHPRNQFWRLTSAVIERDLSTLSYEQRLAALLEAGIGLWDSVAKATRRGSLDADIRLEAANDLSAIAARLPALAAIAFNGGAAAKIGRRALRPDTAIPLIDLPSSSPAYTLGFERKSEAWLQLRNLLRR